MLGGRLVAAQYWGTGTWRDGGHTGPSMARRFEGEDGTKYLGRHHGGQLCEVALVVVWCTGLVLPWCLWQRITSPSSSSPSLLLTAPLVREGGASPSTIAIRLVRKVLFWSPEIWKAELKV